MYSFFRSIISLRRNLENRSKNALVTRAILVGKFTHGGVICVDRRVVSKPRYPRVPLRNNLYSYRQLRWDR